MLSKLRLSMCRASVLAGAAFLLNGCTTVPTAEQKMQAGVLTDVRNMQEDINRLNGRQDQLEAVNDELRATVRALGAAKTVAGAAVEERLDVVEGRLKSIDEAREADKKEMIDKLSKTIADVINKYRGSGERESAGGPVPVGGRDPGATQHVVREKEALSTIAQKYGVTVDAIVRANRLKNANHVRVGQTLIIPR